MDYHDILSALISNQDVDSAKDFDDKLAQILQKTMPLLSKNTEKCAKDLSIRDRYLQVISHVLRGIKQENTAANSDAPFSMKQNHSLKIAIELIVSIGVIPCLLPGVGVGMARLCPRALKISQEEDLGCLEEYERLCSSTLLLLDLFADINLRFAVFPQIASLMAALLQLSHAPLTKPLSVTQQVLNVTQNKKKFCMTIEEYDRLQNRQKEFHIKLISLLNECPQCICFQELMIILGIPNVPKWLRRETKSYLTQMLRQSNGVSSLISVICKDDLDLGRDWQKLDTISRLIVMSHGEKADKYYKAVCPQILDMLSLDKMKCSIANCCIKMLHDYDPHACEKYIINEICAPLIIAIPNVARSEKAIEQCVNSLTNCFLTEDTKFKHLSYKIILHVVVPLFCLYNKARGSACILKMNLRQLLLKFLKKESMREEFFAAFLGYKISTRFGNYVMSQFGPTGGLEITGLSEDLEYDKLADTVFDLISTVEDLAVSLFCYLLKHLSNVNKLNKIAQVLETEDDKMKRFTKKLTAYKLLSQLASTNIVQDAQAKNPELLLSFIKPLFNEYSKNDEAMEESEYEILYISLLLIKSIFTEKKKVKTDLFKDFSAFLKDRRDDANIPTQLKLLMDEVIGCIMHDSNEKSFKFKETYYQDLSIDPITTTSSKFDEALKDLMDPLLPVRAHGLITLTKLIENKDPYAVAHKTIIFGLFQENLKHEDSFIYLTSINGLCALATMFPKEILEILIPEYINMSDHIADGEMSIEIRIKLGEILVKTTRSLGEMSVIYKNMLINGFLCAIRDTEPLIRASSLSCLGELCKVLGFRLGNVIIEIIHCVSCIIKSDKVPECRRAAVMLIELLLRGLGQDALASHDLVPLFHTLLHLYENDKDPVLRVHAQLALLQIDGILTKFLLTKPKL